MSNVVQKNILVVDLDGTLIHSDMLIESASWTLTQPKFNILNFFRELFSRPLRRETLKGYFAKDAEIDPSKLPYNEELLDFLKQEKLKGRTLVLATATNQTLADKIAQYLEFFDEVYGSSAECNLKGVKKSELLVEKYGEYGFDYIGDSRADIPVWSRASGVGFVSCPSSVVDVVKTEKKKRSEKLEIIYQQESKGTYRSLLRAMRPHQWAKNSLLFLPLLLAHQVGNLSLLLLTILGFISFSLIASSVYLLNDLLDIHSDREHPTKCRRPVASGELAPGLVLRYVAVLWIAGMALASLLGLGYLFMVAIYYVLTGLYTFGLKRIALVDLVLLAGLYTIRILSGGVLLDIPVSKWLLLFSIFIFFNLACIKRYCELFGLEDNDGLKYRPYLVEDKTFLLSAGTSSGFMSAVVLGLYLSSSDIDLLYQSSGYLWLALPAILYWISHMWLVTTRGKMDSDPVVFASRDKITYLVVVTILVIGLAGKYLP